MILIADSGSTKTEWCLVNPQRNHQTIYTSGINPFYQSSTQILDTLKNEYSLAQPIERVHFYGAGCANTEKQAIVKQAIGRFFGIDDVDVKSDLEGAALSMCQNKQGIACILGTGSNSCYFDGTAIRANVSPLGFILGDEGSGAVIGKKLIGNLLKNQYPQAVTDLFFETYDTTPADILDHVYKKPFPNRYLAQYTKFVAKHIELPQMQELITVSFDEFISRNILQYPQANELPVHFTGSIAHYFKPQLENALGLHGLHLGTVCQSPMTGLITHHTGQHQSKVL